MKARTIFQGVFGVFITLMFVACATAFATKYSPNPAVWFQAHRSTPLLWLLDFSAIYTLVLTGVLLRNQDHMRVQADHFLRLCEEHHKQLEAAINATEQLERVNEEAQDRIGAMKEQITDRERSFEAERSRLNEQTYESMRGQMDAQSRQLDAVNLAMQYHRAEITQLRKSLRLLHSAADNNEELAEVLRDGMGATISPSVLAERLDALERSYRATTNLADQPDLPVEAVTEKIPALVGVPKAEQNGHHAITNGHAEPLAQNGHTPHPEQNGHTVPAEMNGHHEAEEKPQVELIESFEPTHNGHSTLVLNMNGYNISRRKRTL